MSGEETRSRIERLKKIYRDFFTDFSLLRKKRDAVLERYEQGLEEEQRKSLHRRIDRPSV